MAKKKGRMRYYAIHSSVGHGGVHYDCWANVRNMTQKPGIKHQAFDDQSKAEYFVLHGHEQGRSPSSCATCVKKKKELDTREQSLLHRHQHAAAAGCSRPNVHSQDLDGVVISHGKEEDKDIGLQEPHKEPGFGCCYAVVRGTKPGVYDDWDEAKKQLHGFSGNDYVQCPDQASAVRYLRARGIPIRLFRKTFKLQPNFIPNPTASFKQEFQRFASSQQMTNDVQRKARVDAIRDEIIQYFLPEGVRISDEQDDDEGYVHLDDDQTLEVFQAMCRKAGKSVCSSIDESLLELKRCPFVNILDFVDTFRTGAEVCTFRDWNKFVKYTCAGRKMDMQVAKENEFLAPLLQDLRKGPNAVDPCRVRQRLVAAREALWKERALKQDEVPFSLFSPDHHRSLSPSYFDRVMSPSRSPTPDLKLPQPGIALGNNGHHHVKLENSTATSCDSPFLYEYPSIQPTLFSDSDRQEQYTKLEASQIAPFIPTTRLNWEEETDYVVKVEREQSISPSSSSSFANVISSLTPTNISDEPEQNFKLESIETIPSVVQSLEAIPMIDLTQEEEIRQVTPVPLAVTRVLRKRPSGPSPRNVLRAKKRSAGIADECIFTGSSH